MNELEILEEEIKRKIQVVADGFCPSHPKIRIFKTNIFGFKKSMECSLCSVDRQKMIEQSSNNGRNSSHDIASSTSKLVSNFAIQRIYQTDESIENSPAKYIVQYANGDFYEGGLLNNKRNGIGVWILANGDKFEGNFSDDRLHGEGTYNYINGDIYCGFYSKGKKHGRGTYKWANGDTYEANFINGREDGNGIYTWNSKTVNVCIDSAEERQQETAGDKVVATKDDVHAWSEGNEDNGSQTGEGSRDESWSVGVIFNDLELQEKKHEAYIEVLQSAFIDTKEDSNTDGGSPTRCSSSHSATKSFSFQEVASISGNITTQAGSTGAADDDDGPSGSMLRSNGPSVHQDGSLSQSPSSEINRVSSGDFFQPCLFDEEVDTDDREVESDASNSELNRSRIDYGLLDDQVALHSHSHDTTNGFGEADLEHVGSIMLLESVYAELSESTESQLSEREEEIHLCSTDTVGEIVWETNLEVVSEIIKTAAMIPEVSVTESVLEDPSGLLGNVPQEESYADCEQVLQDIFSRIVFDVSSEVVTVVVCECLGDRDAAIEQAVALVSAALINEQCDDASCTVSEATTALREFSISQCVESHGRDILHESIDALAWELNLELVAIELECFSVAMQHIATVLRNEVIESLLYVLVGDMLTDSNDSIDRGVEIASWEAIDGIVAEQLINIARYEVSEREVSIVKAIEFVFETLRTDISSEEASCIALGCQSAQEQRIEIATMDISQLLLLETIEEDCRAVSETSINERIVYYLAATRVALEEVENMLDVEIAVVVEASLSEWDNLIASATVGVHLQLVDEVVETFSKIFSSEELSARDCCVSDGTFHILNELLATAVNKEFAEVVVYVVAERDSSIQAAMECLCDEELLQTTVACTAEIVMEELRALDISISAAEECIVSMERDAVVQEELLATVIVLLDARMLRIESASHSISADLEVEATQSIIEEIAVQGVLWDVELRDVCEDLMSTIEREVSSDVAQASLSSWEELTSLLVEEVFSTLLLDCMRDDCAIGAYLLESLLEEIAETLTTTLLEEEVAIHMTEEIQQELLSVRLLLEYVVAEFVSMLAEEVVGECSIDLSSAAWNEEYLVVTAQVVIDDRIMLDSVVKVMEEVIERVCMVVVDAVDPPELGINRTSKLLVTSNSANFSTEYVESIPERNFLSELVEGPASNSAKADGTESCTDYIRFHTPQLHSMNFMEGECSVFASEVDFRSCYEGIAWSYAGTSTSKPMTVSALGSSESSSVENYSADAESSVASAGEDECTLNGSDVAEVMSFMKQSSDGTSEYSADGEHSDQCTQRNGNRFGGGYQWSAPESRTEEYPTDFPPNSSDHLVGASEAAGICIRTSNSDDRAMENVSMDFIYNHESPKEKEWMVSPLADGVVGGRSVGQLYGSRSADASDTSSNRMRSSRYSVVYSANGDVYEGAVSADGLFQGHGKLTFFNGDVYEGSFLNGYRSGTGRYTYINGDIYEGRFKNGCKDGKGVYRYQASGAVYEGSYVNDRRHGHGTYIYPNGGKYIGEYINGKKTTGGIYIRRPLNS